MNTDDFEGHTPIWYLYGEVGAWWVQSDFTTHDDFIVAEVRSQNEVDAKLIAAAPDLLQALIDERARIIELEEELVDLRERRRWADTHHAKCEDCCGAMCVPSEEEVERFDKTGDWEEEE
ncbi:MAG: hypothetical protein ACTSWQ_02095 [Candidatus Thorarchaeota archaeon]